MHIRENRIILFLGAILIIQVLIFLQIDALKDSIDNQTRIFEIQFKEMKNSNN